MDARRTTMLFFLLCVFTGEPADGQAVLDVCATCHANATCDDKSDGSGKVCNCKYGFVGNGRTFCQDKDECQIGASRICGHHTTCHNTYGSYFCTCLDGYSPSNNMDIFIPNDGTHCRDIDECRITGVCGEGGQCRNLEGSFECSCQVGYKVHDGAEPFNPQRDKASCRVVDCGRPAPAEDTALQSVTGTTFGGVATFVCDDGFVWRRGADRSVCGADGRWRGLSMVCEEVDCGPPPALPRARLLWDGSRSLGAEAVYQCEPGYRNVGGGNVSVCTAAGRWEGPSVLCQEILCGNPPSVESTEQEWDNNRTPGSTVLYLCKKGFNHAGGRNVSVCSENGQWTPPTLSCKEVLCGDPPVLPHAGQEWNGSSTPGSTLTYFCEPGFYYSRGNNVSECTMNGYWTVPDILCKEVDCGTPLQLPASVMMWDQTSTVGSQVVYQCLPGYVSAGGGNTSVCTSGGEWNGASLQCQEITCGTPVSKPHTEMQWDGSPHVGSVAFYRCHEGYHTRSLRNYSVCGERGLWEDSDLWCEEISCGPPLTRPNTNLLWDRTGAPGSTALYQCVDGFYQESGNNSSTCSLSGEWGEVSVKCKAKCGPIPVLAKAEVAWHNRSVVIHRCMEGHHSWRGSNVSVCGSSGVWQEATLRCIEIKPPINHLSVFNEKCLRWEAEKYEEDAEIYKVLYSGSRDYQRSFRDKGRRFLNSKAERLELCLNLLPVTNYSISITAASARFTATTHANTSLPEPPAPAVYYREIESLLPTLRLHRSPNTLDSISSYQVFVIAVEGLLVFDCSSPATSNPSKEIAPPAGYVAARLDLRRVGSEMNFTVGDGRLYGGFHNAPLEGGKTYYIILRAVSQWKTAMKSSCVVWAKVTGTSYILRVSSLVAAASVGLVVFIIVGVHGIIRCVRKT